MTRPTGVHIDAEALLHNLAQVKQAAPNSHVIAMVKANAYGCGLHHIVPIIADKVYAFGVACLEEALALRSLSPNSNCILFQGVFNAEEWQIVAAFGLQSVIHQENQLKWLLETPLPHKIKIWLKIDTGMHRLGFSPEEISPLLSILKACSWVEEEVGLMTHLASSDEPDNPQNQKQLALFNSLSFPAFKTIRSVANSAAILSLPAAHNQVVRPGIMLYGVSPFANLTGESIGLKPVMHFKSALTAIHHLKTGERVGYGGTWQALKPTTIGVVASGYGDGYPRHIKANTVVDIEGIKVPIIGRVSMDMLSVDLTPCPNPQIGDCVELWGRRIPVEYVAEAAGTIAYELLCQFSPRVSGL